MIGNRQRHDDLGASLRALRADAIVHVVQNIATSWSPPVERELLLALQDRRPTTDWIAIVFDNLNRSQSFRSLVYLEF